MFLVVEIQNSFTGELIGSNIPREICQVKMVDWLKSTPSEEASMSIKKLQ
jgi:hypothetical protein